MDKTQSLPQTGGFFRNQYTTKLMKVLKFGGTSVGSIQAIEQLIAIVKDHQQDKTLIVCSAMGGVTNQLIEMAEAASEGLSYAAQLQNLEQRHSEVAHHFIRQPAQFQKQIEALLAQLEHLLSGIYALRELSARTRDHVMSFGEQLSCTLVAAILNQHHCEAVYTDSRDLLLTDNRFGNAAVNEDISFENIRQWFAGLQACTAVVTGFIARNQSGHTTTIGRGGSDLTAALFGAALVAEEIQIWTDVDGFMTADPRWVKNAFTLTELSYKEAMELSYFGAKVIYPPTMIPAVSRNIPIVIKNTFKPGHPGTFIRPKAASGQGMIKGISSIRRVSLINVEGSGMVGLKGFGGKLFGALADAGVNVILITQASSEHSISFAVAPDDTETALDAIRTGFELELISNKIEAPSADRNLSILAVVGENMRHTKGLSGKLFQSLGRSGVNVVAIAQGSSELNISVVIAEDDLSKALNAVHDSLFLSPVKTLHLFLAGTGNIGAELLRQLEHSDESLRKDHQLHIQVMGITNSRKMIVSNNGGINLGQWQQILDENGETASADGFVRKIEALNLPNSIFVDNTSQPALLPLYESLFSVNVSVVACSKLAASGKFETYSRLKRLARKNGVDFFYETNVGAGLPIIKTMNDLLISGDRFVRIEAILSGTISFVFNNFTQNRNFADVVLEAQQKGFTEPDPRDDLNGLDFARKMLILARETGMMMELEQVQLDQILPKSCVEAKGIEAFYDELNKATPYFDNLRDRALESGKVLRYIGIIQDGQASVKLEMVGPDHPFYHLSGSDNIISFTTLRYRHNPLVVKGPGAGAGVTAAGVFADILRVGAR